jgi:hypothetical protein
MEWSFSQNLHRKETVECLAQDFIEALRALIHQSENREPAELAIEDFADFGWNQDDLEDILKQIDGLD